MAARGTAVLLVEQNVKLVQQLCQRACVLAHGTGQATPAPSTTCWGARVADAYLGGLDLIEDEPNPTTPTAPHEEAPT